MTTFYDTKTNSNVEVNLSEYKKEGSRYVKTTQLRPNIRQTEAVTLNKDGSVSSYSVSRQSAQRGYNNTIKGWRTYETRDVKVSGGQTTQERYRTPDKSFNYDYQKGTRENVGDRARRQENKRRFIYTKGKPETGRYVTTAELNELTTPQPRNRPLNTSVSAKYEFTFTSSGIKGDLSQLTKEERRDVGRQYVEWQKGNTKKQPLGAEGIRQQTNLFAETQQSTQDNDRVSRVMNTYRAPEQTFSLSRYGDIRLKNGNIIPVGSSADFYNKATTKIGRVIDLYEQTPFSKFSPMFAPNVEIVKTSGKTKADITSYMIPVVGQARFLTEGASLGVTLTKGGYQAITGEGQALRMIKQNPTETALTTAIYSAPVILKGYSMIKASRSPQNQILKLTGKIKEARGQNIVVTKTDQTIKNGVLVASKSRTQNTMFSYDLFNSRGVKIGTETKIFNAKGTFLSSKTNIGKNIISVTKGQKGYTAQLLKLKGGDISAVGQKVPVSFGGQKLTLEKQFSVVARQEVITPLSGGRKGYASTTFGGKREVFFDGKILENVDSATQYNIIGEASPTTGYLKTRITQNVGGKELTLFKQEAFKTPVVQLTNNPVTYADKLTFLRSKNFKTGKTIFKPASVEFVTTQKAETQLNYLYIDATRGSSFNPISWGKGAQQQLNPQTLLTPTIQAQKPLIFETQTFGGMSRPSAVSLKQISPVKSESLKVIPIISLNKGSGSDFDFYAKTNEIQQTKIRPQEIFNTKEKNISILGEPQKQNIKLSQSNIFESSVKQRLSVAQKVSTIQQTKPIIDIKETTKQQTTPRQKQTPIQKSAFPRFNTKTNIPRIPFVPFAPLFNPQNKKRDLFGGFNVFVKRRGSFFKANTNPLSQSDAINKGAFIVGTTSSATFKISPTSEGTRGIFRGKGNLGDFYKKGDLFIEKRKRRIKSSGERQEITFKGIATKKARSKKGIFGGFKSVF